MDASSAPPGCKARGGGAQCTVVSTVPEAAIRNEAATEAIIRWVAIAAACAGGFLFIDWLVTQPAALVRRGDVSLFPSVIYMMGSRRVDPGVTRAVLTLIAMTGAAACTLAIMLAWRGASSPPARRLSLSLAMGSVAVGYLVFVWAHPAYRDLLAWQGGVDAHLVLDFIGYSCAAIAVWQLAAFFEIYPRPIAPGDWAKYLAATRADDIRKMFSGWRGRVFFWARKEPAHWDGIMIRPARLAPLYVAAIMGVAPIFAMTNYFVRSRVDKPAGWDAAIFVGAICIGSSVFMGIALRCFRLMQFHQRLGLPDDRLRIEWIYATTLAGGIVALSLPITGMLLFSAWVYADPDSSVAHSAGLLFTLPMMLAPALFAASLLVALAMSIFYRGAVDPRFAARKLTVWWLIGALVAVVFVLIERAVAIRLVHWLGLPPDTGFLLAGALVAGTFAPMRHSAEKSMTRMVSHWLPVESAMNGERRNVVVAMSDLSGYTALSARDEKQALLLAALLHRLAERVAKDHHGRLVKSIGDAVMLEFPDATGASGALAALHAEFPAAARAIGLEPLPVHSGAHIGEVVVGRDGDLFGQTVNLAARLQGEAQHGQIVVSDAFIAGLDAERGNHRTLGMRRLKNVPEPMQCHELLNA